MSTLLLVLLLLQVKHLVIDWILQPQWMWSKKHIYGHWGGIAHAGLNALGTAIVIAPFFGHFLLVLAIDFIAHYHIDWAKMNLNNWAGWGPNTHPQFWWLLGADQFAHQVTYLALLLMLI